MSDYADNQPSWVKDMIAHIQFDRASDASENGDDVSVYWEPHLTSLTDPFTTHSPADTICMLHDDDLPSGEFSIPPSRRSRSSPTGGPSDTDSDAPSQSSTVLVLYPASTSTDGSWHNSPCASESSAVTVPTNLARGDSEISPGIAPNESDSDVELAALVQLPSYQRLCLDKISKNHRPTAMRTKIKVGLVACEAQASTTRQTCKRKIDDDVDAKHDADKENISLSSTPAIKRICREKTGTDWQSVLDINKYVEERLGYRQSKGTVTPVVEENSR
ncbi:hypothetical protein DEU56DRAFT_753730 [Suillus clintonianus]|uniref:uncharacterized protein n=1 Tax=Suillus clintonianus TaxID=1904413 RepID=UPI001B86674C|nr:uncharacterized protein DEU56DRAFT_753730 [Suillus clintonianus]KAG2146229.1 hypothetical protein DEU56DRAFT_753730 [Suillus clintonianus]